MLNLLGRPLWMPSNIDRFPFNSAKLQQFLESMNELQEFHLYAKLGNYRMNKEIDLPNFQNQYWFNHNLSFGMHDQYFYTLPFHFDHLYKFSNGFNYVKTNNREILINNPRI